MLFQLCNKNTAVVFVNKYENGQTKQVAMCLPCAKKNGLDAIHDTVHEMARDEARHGKALKGLLERYFK